MVVVRSGFKEGFQLVMGTFYNLVTAFSQCGSCQLKVITEVMSNDVSFDRHCDTKSDHGKFPTLFKVRCYVFVIDIDNLFMRNSVDLIDAV